jgi:hypothetical protein
VSERPRIGELLLARQLVDETMLRRALAEQGATHQRLCSILIARGWLHPDDAVHALAEQHEMAGALQRHLTGRDPVLAKLLPAELARAWQALPIGRMRGGELIVCVRDPARDLIPELERATHGPVLLAIAPATQLEALVLSAYGPSPEGEADVSFETGPIAVVDNETFKLVDLDDAGVSKMTQQIHLEAHLETRAQPSRAPEPRLLPQPSRPPEASRLPPQPSRPPNEDRPALSRTATPIPRITEPVSPPPPRIPTPPPAAKAPIALDFTLKALDRAATRDDATDVAMAFADSRWPASLLLAIKEGAALGHRGHGPQISDDALQALSLPLSAPTIVKLAHDSRRIATVTPPDAGAIQDRLERLVGEGPLAAPVFVGSHVACVFVVGCDALDALAGAELERLATALGVAYTRIVLDAKKS